MLFAPPLLNTKLYLAGAVDALASNQRRLPLCRSNIIYDPDSEEDVQKGYILLPFPG